MNQIFWLLNKRIDSKLVTSCVLSLSLVVTPTALAEYKQPPDQRPPRGYTTSSGPRGGCEVNGGPQLTLLAPQKHVGQTTSLHPTFAWFVPDSRPFPIEFMLFYESGSGRELKLVKKIKLQSSPGIMKLSLPEDKPGLAVGQRYLWQVAILCDPNYPSRDLVVKSEIEIVEMPPAVKRALSATSDRLEIAELYARAGLWYDALGEALGHAEDSRLGGIASTLLEELAKLEEAEATQVGSRQSANLRQIVSSERQQGSPRSQLLN